METYHLTPPLPHIETAIRRIGMVFGWSDTHSEAEVTRFVTDLNTQKGNSETNMAAVGVLPTPVNNDPRCSALTRVIPTHGPRLFVHGRVHGRGG